MNEHDASEGLASSNQLVLEKLDLVLDMIQSMARILTHYEPLLIEAERRMAGPLSFGRKKHDR